eukprot:4471802-Karenia_brevis.AAC.1
MAAHCTRGTSVSEHNPSCQACGALSCPTVKCGRSNCHPCPPPLETKSCDQLPGALCSHLTFPAPPQISDGTNMHRSHSL